ncbi:tRNA uridine-5-carboxymethylaminomethyl(34) synthesis GTPase MnmE [Azospirillum halopraeferens]|uniref:tRNA uridine-5-carboxymethylaminomethyl(34) synthesis GTPase MnmE n=1 Tax=Azospirillum halopraeferens TaxID=34010 RepID=UPI0004916D26|nr:tRNA uridine-5-carboxymethylaminomethyl(34) synthesis GTPase MnmE [Azospirillum halopraeferens]
MTDTIFALATAPGRAGVAVVRVSGPAAGGALEALAGTPRPSPRVATLRRLRDPASAEVLDDALVLWFPGPRSYTGEDVAELHLHGGRAVTAAVLDALGRCPGLRPAEPGDFTRRAFANGKMDLTAAEGLIDLIDAETSAQRRQALRQMEGELGRLYEGWRTRLIRALAHMEADIDFPDEDLPAGVADAVRPEITDLIRAIGAHLSDGHRGERLREGLHVAIVGAPNAGKSSLLNALARRDAAIVSERAGTTRDVIEVHLDVGGFPVVLADTAGLRETADTIEEEGVRRALARAASADLKIAVFDAAALPHLDGGTLALVDDDSLVVVNKCDLPGVGTAVRAAESALSGCPLLAVSARVGTGLGDLEARLAAAAGERLTGSGAPALTRTRHRVALEACRAALERALTAPLPELAAEDVRLAAAALGRITGRVDVDDLLDVIFRDFCIGK